MIGQGLAALTLGLLVLAFDLVTLPARPWIRRRAVATDELAALAQGARQAKDNLSGSIKKGLVKTGR